MADNEEFPDAEMPYIEGGKRFSSRADAELVKGGYNKYLANFLNTLEMDAAVEGEAEPLPPLNEIIVRRAQGIGELPYYYEVQQWQTEHQSLSTNLPPAAAPPSSAK